MERGEKHQKTEGPAHLHTFLACGAEGAFIKFNPPPGWAQPFGEGGGAQGRPGWGGVWDGGGGGGGARAGGGGGRRGGPILETGGTI